jgi:hypothetical protein
MRLWEADRKAEVLSESEKADARPAYKQPSFGSAGIIQGRYLLSMVAAAGWFGFGIVWIGYSIVLITRSLPWDGGWGIVVGLGAAVSGVSMFSNSRRVLRLNSVGIRAVKGGTWQISWDEIASVRLSATELVIEPRGEAWQRRSIRIAALYSRILAPGRHPRGTIVLPSPELNADAMALLKARGVELLGNTTGGLR